MARGISIRDVSNKIKNISDKDVLPISTGDNQPKVIIFGPELRQNMILLQQKIIILYIL